MSCRREGEAGHQAGHREHAAAGERIVAQAGGFSDVVHFGILPCGCRQGQDGASGVGIPWGRLGAGGGLARRVGGSEGGWEMVEAGARGSLARTRARRRWRDNNLGARAADGAMTSR